MTRSIPARRPTASAVLRLSPVSMTTENPSALSPATTEAASSFNVSAMPRTPAAAPSMATPIRVHPSPESLSALSFKEFKGTPLSSRSFRLPARTVRPATTARTPSPPKARNPSGSAGLMPSSAAFSSTARPRGCSERFSAEETQKRRFPASKPSTGATSMTWGLPRVSVPVLSKTTVRTA